MTETTVLPPRFSPWPHRLAAALALVTFPLIWVGGLVTTYDAGMAVPDWPGTYGYNLLLYPWQSWVAGPFDLFIEHGHRLLGAAAGLVAIALVAATVVTRAPRWLRWAAAGALTLVILQGVLGGLRVLFDARIVALLHGCLGPLFFAYGAGLAVATSRWWSAAEPQASQPGRRLVGAAWLLAVMSYAQLVLGAAVRHMPLSAPAHWFRAALLLHLILAGLLVWQVAAVSIRARRAGQASGAISGLGLSGLGWTLPRLALPLLLGGQVALGLSTYIVKYSWPAWLADYRFAAGYVVQEKSLAQSLVTTAHVAIGSLIVFTSVWLAMRASRRFGVRAAASPTPPADAAWASASQRRPAA